MFLQACISHRDFKPAELQERANRQVELEEYEAGMEEMEEQVDEQDEY